MKLRKGDVIKCHSKEDAVNVLCTLTKDENGNHLDAEIIYEYLGKQGFFVQILKESEDE